MRETTSKHTQCIHTPASRVWQTTRPFRPFLNVPLLTKLLSAATPDVVISNLGKRKATEAIPLLHRFKRLKTSCGSQDSDSEDDGEGETSDVLSTADGDYPPVRIAENYTADNDVHPILHHIFEIRYTKEHSERSGFEDIQLLEAWEHDVEALQDFLHLRDSISCQRTINIDNIRLGSYDGRVVALLSEAKHLTDNQWLFLLPLLTVDGPSNDYSELASNDFLSACLILQASGKVSIETKLEVVIQPKSLDGAASFDFPVSLRFEVTVSLSLPRALEYTMPKKSTRKDVTIHENAQRRLLRAAFDEDSITSSTVRDSISISSFYSVMGPAPSLASKEVMESMQPDALLPTLLPFQCRSVAWLLEKEGKSILSDGLIVSQASPTSFSFWKEVQVGNHSLYFNYLSGELVDEKPHLPIVHGGMLAEEPGLGKTLETIALIQLNPAPSEWNPSFTSWDDIACLEVKAVKTTLIVTPPSLVSQWRDELSNNAPTLKVLIYDGWTKVAVPIVKDDRELQQLRPLGLDDNLQKKKNGAKGKKRASDDSDYTDSSTVAQESTPRRSRRRRNNQLDWCNHVHQFDVVITTYSVLRSEIWVARPPPDRPKREEAMYTATARARSPLVMVKWQRVVMDEVQMVGGGQAAEMVSLIPRISSLAVSGTPAKTQTSDLIHVLKFLRIDRVVGNLRLWNRLLKPGFSDLFGDFLRHYAIRTAKSSLTSELTIPAQTRYLVGIELGKVERHVYDQTLEAILFDLGLDSRGIAASNGWRVDGVLLRSSIRRLRGICTHPQVGQLQRKGDGIYKPGSLKAMDDVLQTMRDQNWKTMMEDWKAKMQAAIKIARFTQFDKTDNNRYQHARDMLQGAEAEVWKHIKVIEETLAEHDLKGKALKTETALHNENELQNKDQDSTVESKGKGKARLIPEDDAPEDEEEKGLPQTLAGEEYNSRRLAIKQRLREGLLLLHKVNFLRGDVHHTLGNSAEEDKAYQVAEELRRRLLKGPEEEAKKAIHILNASATRKNLIEAELLLKLPLLGKGGIRSAELMEEVNTLLEEVFNEQAKLLWEWRTHLLKILTKPLTPDDGDTADGQEYQRTLDEQGEADTYLQAYAALVADRRQALVNERTLLAAHEGREKKHRQTKVAKATSVFEDDEDHDEHDERSMESEQAPLQKTLTRKRKDILLHLGGRAIKSILVDLTAVNLRITPDNHPEKFIVKDAIKSIRQFMAEQSSLFDKLEGDLALIRKAFNQRVLYFRQLQEISDSVAEADWEESSFLAAQQACQAEMVELERKINTARARQRYLDNLAQNKDDNEDNDQTCILCRCEFARGFITPCAHVFCEWCMKAWCSKNKGKTCPVCRVAVDLKTVQRFVVDATEPEPLPTSTQPVINEPAPKSRREIIYNRISSSVFDDIQNIETHGDFGSKIQTLVRHICYLKSTDPGAKSIIFSAWADSLHIVEVALKENNIKSLRINQRSGGGAAIQKFRKDPDILVLLLDGERENTGLNITCASRVFLLESVVHHNFEIQAIARIDRLGQTKPTEVYCYYAEDTIERNILDLGARKGLSLYTKANSVGTVSVSPFTKESEQVVDNPNKRKAQQKGDFIYKVDDMLAILFPHMFEDIEYLLPATEEAQARQPLDVEMVDATLGVKRSVRGGIEVNAEAGPSRRTR